jgi:hypothetical protein
MMKTKKEQQVRTTIYNIDTSIIKDIRGEKHVNIIDKMIPTTCGIDAEGIKNIPEVLRYN